MGFCRRCGEIVTGQRCRCGGMAVAPVVAWNQANPKEQTQDRWSKTYVSRDSSPTRNAVETHVTGTTAPATVPALAPAPTNPAPSSPTKRFPRPLSKTTSAIPGLGSRVSTHIASTTSQLNRPPSPLKYSTLPAPESDILPSPSPAAGTLSKVYGSVLQPRESLAKHACAICATPFPPDATIYPEPIPSSPSTSPKFLCRPCFTTNGGSKGTCPTCSRPVLALKAEGGFVHAADHFWHKGCFNCEACHKNIGNAPMVDLMGRPSCAECFDNCLKRDRTPKKSLNGSVNNSPNPNMGSMRSSTKSGMSREGSPHIDELHQRLGIQSRESSPELEELSQRLNKIGREGTIRSPRISRYSTASPTTNSPGLRSSVRSRDGSPSMSRSGSRDNLREHLRSPDVEQRRSLDLRSYSGDSSPTRNTTRLSNDDAIEEMKNRFRKSTSSPSASSLNLTTPSTPPQRSPLRGSQSSGSLSAIFNLNERTSSPRSPLYPPTPDLISDYSDTATQSSSSGPDSPPRDDASDADGSSARLYGRGYGTRYTRSNFMDDHEEAIIEETNSQMGTPTHTPKNKSTISATTTPTSMANRLTPSSSPAKSPSPASTRQPLTVQTDMSSTANCAGCHRKLFAIRDKGSFVTVPDDQVEGSSKTYHTDCFKCAICKGAFRQGSDGQAVFVKIDQGPCHMECAPPTKVNIRTVSSSPSAGSIFSREKASPWTPSTQSTSTSALNSISPPKPISSSRYDRSPLTAPPTSTPTTFPRFGGSNACPGCHKAVSPMEFGVVPGPQGTRWHGSCLVCGGKKEVKGFGRGREERKKGTPGCGKKLDSAAKGDGEGGVWCRECLLLLPMGTGRSPQASPTRPPVVPSHTGTGFGRVAPQYTGTTTIARQFTGMGGDGGLLRQMTGGGLSPTRTRSISPTKQLGMMRPRPKSVIGMRNTKSVDEGRGMFLVRQMTGAGGWDD